MLESNYNKNIPPIGRSAEGGSVQADVGVSLTLMKVVEIEERDHSVHLQFEINLQWRENRVKYQNLKEETSLNALNMEDVRNIWLPRIIYANTDQKESTRVGMDWEWATGVSVQREGEFTRSGKNEVDEAEIFEGAENILIMTQTYTHQFQCKYQLQQYPFDTQVRVVDAQFFKTIFKLFSLLVFRCFMMRKNCTNIYKNHIVWLFETYGA